MQYISPFTLTLNTGVALVDEKSILLAKKMMLAEIDLNDGTGITVNNHGFTKNDVIVFFDGLLQPYNLSYHTAIANDVVLLTFLEQGTIDENNWFVANPLYTDNGFLAWVSQYYYTSFNRFAATCFKNLYSSQWQALMANAVLMTVADQEKAWAKVERLIERNLEILHTFLQKNEKPATYLTKLEGWIKGNLEDLHTFLQKKKKKDRHFVEPLVSQSLINMLQHLPAARFTALNNRYAAIIFALARYFFNNGSEDYAIAILRRTPAIATSEDLRKDITELFIFMKRFAGLNKDRRLFRVGKIIAIVFLLGVIIYGSFQEDTTKNGKPANNTIDSIAPKNIPKK